MPTNVIPDTHRDLLDKPLLAHVATTGPKGEPQSNPVWFLWQDDQIWLAIHPTGQKARNLERDSRIALSMADPDDPIHYLELRGSAGERRTVGSDDPFVREMVRKYTGDVTYDGMPDEHFLVAIEPVRATTM